MWGVLHLTGYIVGGPLWAFCCSLWRGIWDREIALWFLSSWAQGLPSGVIVAICYRIQVMCICGKQFTFNFHNALFKKVLSLFYRRERWDSRTAFSKIFESVNDEFWFGFKSKSSMTVSLLDGQCVKSVWNMLSELINAVGLRIKSWAPTYKW